MQTAGRVSYVTASQEQAVQRFFAKTNRCRALGAEQSVFLEERRSIRFHVRIVHGDCMYTVRTSLRAFKLASRVPLSTATPLVGNGCCQSQQKLQQHRSVSYVRHGWDQSVVTALSAAAAPGRGDSFCAARSHGPLNNVGGNFLPSPVDQWLVVNACDRV